MKSNARHLKKVAPNMTSKLWIPVADNRRRKPMQADNAVEEGAGDRSSGVGVAERDEVRVLGEAIDHR